jgi:hypothetical protein
MTKLFGVEMVLANFDELFASHNPDDGRVIFPARGLWQKAVLVPEQEEYVLVAPSIPSNLTSRSEAWFAPGSVIVPLPHSGQLCTDLLRDGETLKRLLAEVSSKSPVKLWAQVFSPGVTKIVEALSARGIDVDTTELPVVSPQRVAFWNTKIGGRELLQSIPVIREALPAAFVANTLIEVISILATADVNQGLVVKANLSIGGSGVWMFPLGEPRQPEELGKKLTTRHRAQERGAKSIPMGDVIGPYVIEEMVGVPGDNSSPTVDFRINSDGRVELIGLGEQSLKDAVAYRGCHYPARGDQAQFEHCISLGHQICAELHRRGYRGLVNLDFVMLQDGRVLVSEMNLRQSSPLDQFLVMRRLFGERWPQDKSFICEEDVTLRLPVEETNTLSQFLDSHLKLEVGELVQPLAIYDGGGTSRREVSLLTVANSLTAAETLAAAARSLANGV